MISPEMQENIPGGDVPAGEAPAGQRGERPGQTQNHSSGVWSGGMADRAWASGAGEPGRIQGSGA